jgi:hypothetical protein
VGRGTCFVRRGEARRLSIETFFDEDRHFAVRFPLVCFILEGVADEDVELLEAPEESIATPLGENTLFILCAAKLHSVNADPELSESLMATGIDLRV